MNEMWLPDTIKIFTIINIYVLSISFSLLPENAYTPYTIIQSIKTNESRLKEGLDRHLAKINGNIVLLRIYYIIIESKRVNGLTEYLDISSLFSGSKAFTEISNSLLTRIKLIENRNSIRKSKQHILSSTHRYPALRDFREAARVLAFIRQFYILNETKLSYGEIQIEDNKEKTILTHSTLNSFDTIYIAFIALKNKWIDSGRAWIHLAENIPYYLKRYLRTSLWYKVQIHLNRSSANEGVIPKGDGFHVEGTHSWTNQILDVFGNEHSLQTRDKRFSTFNDGVDCK